MEVLFGIPRRTQSAISLSGEARTYHGLSKERGFVDERGRKPLIRRDEIADIEYYLEEKRFDAKTLPWPLLVRETGFNTHQSVKKLDSSLLLNPSALNEKRQSQRIFE